MSRLHWMLPVLLLAGCSTSPCADFLDHFWPAKPTGSGAGGYGGVCNPTPTGPGVSGGGPVLPGSPPALAPMNAPGGAPVVVPPPGTTPNNTTPYVPGGSAPTPGVANPPALGNLPTPDLNGIPTSNQPNGNGNESKPLPPPPGSSAPPLDRPSY